MDVWGVWKVYESKKFREVTTRRESEMARAGLRKVPRQAEDSGRAIKCPSRHAMSDRWWYFTWSIEGREDKARLVLGEKRGFASKWDVQPNWSTCNGIGSAIDRQIFARETHCKVNIFAGLRESGQGWNAQPLKDYDQDVGRKGNYGCNHEECPNQGTFSGFMYTLSDGESQADSQQPCGAVTVMSGGSRIT